MLFSQFIQTFIFMLVAGTLSVTGWYFITRGEKETLPDGSIKKRGKVFMDWYFFWTKTKKQKKRIQYTGKQLEFLYKEYLEFYPENPYGLSEMEMDDTQLHFDTREGIKNFFDDKKEVEFNLGAVSIAKGFTVIFLKEYDDYIFPWWIRDPLAVCATCFASVYGSIFYWVVIYLQHGLFRWSYHPVAAAIAFWGIFCLSLAVLNTALAKKFN